MLLATALVLLLQDVLNRRLLFKQTGSSSTKGNHHPSFRFGIGEEKSTWSKFVAAQKMLLKQKPKNICNDLLGFITLAFIPAERACIKLRLADWY